MVSGVCGVCVVVDVRHCFPVDGEWSVWGVCGSRCKTLFSS